MTVKEVVEKMDDFTDEERKKYLALLYENLTPVSKVQLKNFQDNWQPEFEVIGDITADFSRFKIAQNKEIRRCVEIELSKLGCQVRQSLGLQSLNENDEV